MADGVDTVAVIRLLADEFERRGWRDPGDVALRMGRALEGGATPRTAAHDVPSRFLAMNGIGRADVEAAAARVLAGVPPFRAGDQTAPRATVATESREGGAATVRREDAARRQGPRLVTRVLGAAVLAVAGSALIWQAPTTLEWSWLLEHGNRLALQALAQAVVVLVSVALATWRWAIAAAASVPLFALLGLLGA